MLILIKEACGRDGQMYNGIQNRRGYCQACKEKLGGCVIPAMIQVELNSPGVAKLVTVEKYKEKRSWGDDEE